MPCARDHRCNPVIPMGVRSNACMCWNAQHDGIYASLVWIAFQNNSLYTANTGAPSARIASLRELIFGGSKSLFSRFVSGTACVSNRGTVNEFTNQRHRVFGSLFHQPMS